MKYTLLILALAAATLLRAQVVNPDLHNKEQWTVYNRSVEGVTEDGKKIARFDAQESDGLMVLKGVDFSDGIIEFDIKGRNVMQQSFVGIAFHVQDSLNYEAVYFRPFNFLNPDTARRGRSVQYIAMPGYPWEKLREAFPGKYENKVIPVPDPDGWFHVKLVVDGKKIAVYVNDAAAPSLQVEKLTGTKGGGVALWAGFNSPGDFANLTIKPAR